MGFVVLHIQKAKGNDAGTTAHIERTIHPQNADESRTHLNRELVDFPQGVETRTQAIQHRIETAGITRKIKTDQVRAMRIMLSGSPDEMQKIQDTGQLDEWCNDNLDWLKQTFGSENLVSASLHLDEKTPHIHATVVPIVTGERRKAKQEQSTTKKKYKTKKPSSARLCADDVMARDKLKAYQESYALRMQKYGLQRGIEGSEAKHINAQQYNRELSIQNQEIQENIEILQKEKEAKQKEVDKLKNQANTERIKVSIGDLFTGSKTKKLEQENAELKDHVESLKTQLSNEKSDKYYLTTKYEGQLKEKQGLIDKIFDYFPEVKEKLWVARFCETLQLGVDMIKQLLTGQPITGSGVIYSPEHSQKFKAEKSTLQIEENPKEKGKFRLSIDKMYISDWFKMKKTEFLESIGIKIQPIQDKKQGLGM